ncbi:MAG: 2,3-bisphosphoglycerate-independent phosphoglycerate mutase [Aestuariivita sp.]|nr:2,3-bisphosphoglycerate-independent phosphoglycerate mutase [Aestuariivita sp.]MCY4346556.1 2,3-bisphosphoglycerate-independent phosphoglycerate mutase [Aestuariivita sp.]
MVPKRPVVLCILDGWGESEHLEGNAPYLARTPNFDSLIRTRPRARLITHGRDVGLPAGQMGNSEVGHANIGAGRIIEMDLGRINSAIADGGFANAAALTEFIATLKSSAGKAHLIALISDGGVHGHIDHIIAAANLLSSQGIPVELHAIADGRDTAPRSAETFIDRLESELSDRAKIVTLVGRYFAMDRDNRWMRTQSAYQAIIAGSGRKATDLRNALSNAYDHDETDEFIQATVIGDFEGCEDRDGVFCLNFRADRVRQLMSAIGQPDFDEFYVRNRPTFAALLGMVEYSADHNAYMQTVFSADEVVNTLGSWLAQNGLKQFRLAETEKYPHVTFFFNSGKEEPEEYEDRLMVNSPKVATYDLQPEMSAPEVTRCLVNAIQQDYDLIVVNFANPDMVGHTGDLVAAIRACETVDQGLGEAVGAITAADGAMLVTADHGNCETMINPSTGQPHTAHTCNLVPIFLVGGPSGVELRDGRLADVAPTLLDLLAIRPPHEMTGTSLLKET